MTTPEQLAKWREKFESHFEYTPVLNDDGDYFDNTQIQWQGYLRRCQETEQALKAVRKQTLEEAIAICKNACYIYSTDEHRKAHNGGAEQCEKKIKELLND